MLPLQGAVGYLALKTQGGAIGLMTNMAFSQNKNATKWQYIINPTATPWDTKQRSANNALQG
jgi:hypothetical protein